MKTPKKERWNHLKLYVAAHPRTPWRICWKQGGKRLQKWFTTRDDAVTWGDAKEIELMNAGAGDAALTADEKAAVSLWRESGIKRVTLAQALAEIIAKEKQREKSVPLIAAIESLMGLRQSEGKAKKSLIDLEYRLMRFARDLGEDKPLSEIDTPELNRWLSKLGESFSAQSVKNFRRVVHGLFTHAVHQGWIQENPAHAALNPKVAHQEIEIYTPKEAASMLKNCADDAIPSLVLSLFCGLRTAEIGALTWGRIDLNQGHIRLLRTKTGRPRIVPIATNALAWLKPHKLADDELVFPRGERMLNQRWADARKAAGILAAKDNAGRHSFGSYRVATTQNVAQVALEMGNSPDVIQKHYREIVTPSDAKKFWKITPPKA
jgi:integrase